MYESWRFLLGELNAVRAELWHLTLPFSSSGQLTKEGLQVMEAREWLETCERLVKANAALGLKNFTELLVLQAVKMTGRTRGWNKLLLPDLSIEQYLDGKSRQWTEILAEDRVELEGKGDGAHFFFYTESAFSKNESSAPPPSAISFPLTELEKQKETTGLCSLSRTRFSALQITRIGREILSSDELFSHIATAYYASLKQRESILHPVRYEDYLFTFRAAFTEMLGDLYDAV